MARISSRLRSVVLFTSPGCTLCERARAVLDREGVVYDEVDITGHEALEARYREWLPVVEIDGKRAFTYFVQPDALRRRLAQATASEGTL